MALIDQVPKTNITALSKRFRRGFTGSPSQFSKLTVPNRNPINRKTYSFKVEYIDSSKGAAL
jgi:hypothetical protein